MLWPYRSCTQDDVSNSPPEFLCGYDRFKRSVLLIAFPTILLACTYQAHAEPNQIGQEGLIYMPDARVAAEGTWRIGYSYAKPYAALWTSIAMFPRLELSGRYTSIDNTTAFADRADADYGTDKDKAFDAKLVLFKESKWLPQLTIGTQDFLGTKLFNTKFITVSKQLGEIDVSLGYGEDRIDGMFGGLRYAPNWARDWRFVAEYDATDYASDRAATTSGAVDRSAGTTLGIEYHWGWLGAQYSYQDGTHGLNAYVSIPLDQKEFIPKIDEPRPYTTAVSRVDIKIWQQDPTQAQALVRALEIQNFRNVRVRFENKTIEIGFSQTRISLVGRAIGRALRTVMLMSPSDTQRIKLTYYTTTNLPVVSYEFKDLDLVDAFFSGKATYGDMLKEMVVSFADPDQAKELANLPYIGTGDAVDDSMKVMQNEGGHALSFKSEDKNAGQFRIVPFNVGIYFNDPSGAFKYDLFTTFKYSKPLSRGLFLEATARTRLAENVSDVTQPSNSTLEHVRTDVADYKRQGGTKIDTLLLNKFYQPAYRVYARASAGIYEEMFGGAGGQILYLSNTQNWVVDLSVDWLRQRDTEGGFGFRDYKTISSLAAFHYIFKEQGVNLTLRAGQFLAEDTGVRFEFSRRFRSGIKLGAWYTITNGNDTTGPGTIDDPYYDKGIFMTIPLNTMLTKDTQAAPNMSLRPWTRDVGEMVRSPADLFDIVEEALVLDRPGHHLLSDFHF